MKIMAEYYDEKYCIEIPDDSCIDDAVYAVKKLLFCMGYAHKNIEEVFGEEECA